MIINWLKETIEKYFYSIYIIVIFYLIAKPRLDKKYGKLIPLQITISVFSIFLLFYLMHKISKLHEEGNINRVVLNIILFVLLLTLLVSDYIFPIPVGLVILDMIL
jgi:hypothetical protein